MSESRNYLINPVFVYAGVFGVYLAFPVISVLLFPEQSQLFLGDAWDVSIVYKGLGLFFLSVFGFFVGARFAKFGSRQNAASPLFTPATAQFIRVILIPVLLFSVMLQGSDYFAINYLGGDDAYGFYSLPPLIRAGIAIRYFTFEYLVTAILIWDWAYYRRIRVSTIIIVAVCYLFMINGMKRLEMLTPLISIGAYVYLDKRRSMARAILWLGFLVLAFSYIGAFRLGNDFDVSSVISFVLEANFTTNSFFRTIELVDSFGYPYTFGMELLKLPLDLIPTLLFPNKAEIGFVANVWADRSEVSPLGAFYGLAHLYRYGGVVAVFVGSLFLGYLISAMHRGFVRSLIGRGLPSIIYPTILFPFMFHYVRDDLTVALKMVGQFFLLVLIVSQFCKIFPVKFAVSGDR